MRLFSRTYPVKYGFASAAAAIDYYSLLGIDRAATTEQIREAYAKATRNVNPDSNSALFNRISEAFVILTDIKARDAYDSLMKSRRSSYINDPPAGKSKANSYLADRKELRYEYNHSGASSCLNNSIWTSLGGTEVACLRGRAKPEVQHWRRWELCNT